MGLFPRSWRQSYGAEVAEHLAAGRCPVRDRIDLVLAVGPAWIDWLAGKRSAMRTIVITAVVLVAVGLVTTVRATTQLARGLVEIPGHWWSTLAAAPLAAGLAMLLVVLLAQRTRMCGGTSRKTRGSTIGS
ncbi:MAG: hypothetical protein ACRD0A_20540 [Acidimicrobiales bacterium]